MLHEVLYINYFFLFIGISWSKAQSATLYIVRATDPVLTLGKLNVFMDGELLCKINNNRFSIHNITKGVRQFQVRYGGKKAKKSICNYEIDVHENNTYYLSIDKHDHFLYNDIMLTQLTENSGQKLISNLKQDKNCD